MVDQAVVDAKKSPEPSMDEFWTDIYVKGTEDGPMRGCDPQEVHHFK
jgi:pyruvate dehydrogenase E1 component alpha subunit